MSVRMNELRMWNNSTNPEDYFIIIREVKDSISIRKYIVRYLLNGATSTMYPNVLILQTHKVSDAEHKDQPD